MIEKLALFPLQNGCELQPVMVPLDALAKKHIYSKFVAALL
jgi:hypothetical protein